MKDLKLVLKEHKKKTIVRVGNVKIGEGFIVIAGPCAVESGEQLLKTAEIVKKYKADMLRGGAFKPRSSPYSFQGLGEAGLKMLKKAKEKTNLPIVTEVMDASQIDAVKKYADILQVGARNMQNFFLLKEIGKQEKPVLLKRNFSATIHEFLLAAEYILKEGNENLILCERGIRTFEDYTRNTLDLSCVAAVKQLSHLPIIVDPSHATGRKELILPMSMAAKAAGADGIIIEVHPNPAKALCDGAQSLNEGEFKELMENIYQTI